MLLGLGLGLNIVRKIRGFVGLLDLYSNAAAAYSLRKLSANYTGSAIEVRRASDNVSASFGFDSNGNLDTVSLLNWTNNLDQPLLDYATGSAAAYSLRKVTSDSPVTTLPANFGSGAKAAYSLRKVNANYTGSAIEVRRSSDNVSASFGFDSNGDLDTTALTTFVNEEYDHIDEDFSSDLGWTFLNGTSNISGGTLNFNTSTNDYAFYSYGAVPNQVIDIEFTISNYVSGEIFMINFGGGYSSPTYKANQTVTLTDITNGNGNQNWGFRAGGTGFVGSIDNFKVTVKTADGHVKTWYDQSGEGNYASNGTNTGQPLIVEAGDVLLENGKPAIKFDGTSDFLNINALSGEARIDAFRVVQTNDNKYIIFSEDASLSRVGIIVDSADASADGPFNFGSPSYYINGNLYTGTTRTDAFNNFNGYKITSIINASTSLWSGFRIGGAGSFFFNGKVQELIFFNSDQSSNRKDIEWEINNYYNIYSQWDRQSAIEVRRSSDNASSSFGFDSNGDLDTTALTTFVNEDVILYQSDFSSGGSDFTFLDKYTQDKGITFEGRNNVSKFTVNTSGSGIIGPILNSLPVGVGIKLNFSFYLPSTNAAANGFAQFNTYTQYNSSTTDQWVDVETTGTSTSNDVFFRLRDDGDINLPAEAIGDVVYMSNVTVTQTTADGHIKTWYDQSGNNNHATQTTNNDYQPKIVNTGSLVTENSKAAIDFDGVDDELEDATVSIDSIAYSAYMVTNTTGNTVRTLFRNRELGAYGAQEGVAFFELTNADQLQNTFIDDGAGNAIGIANGASVSDGQHLLITEFTTSSAALYVDGTSTGTHDQVEAGSTPLASVSLPYINIGGARFSRPWSSTIQEIILYPSDQSSNRLGIETNINAYYNIYTNPSASAFVKTWYDQSGNNNYATQTTNNNQPLIVNTGSLVLENGKAAIDFDGVDDYLEFASGLFVSEHSIFATIKQDNQDGAIIAISSGGGYYLRYTTITPSSLLWYIPDTTNSTLSFSNETSNQELITAIKGFANVYSYINGGNETTRPSTGDLTSTPSAIGRYASSNYFGGDMQELILYPSDQSTNRPFIERLINNQYTIFEESAPTITGAPTISGDVQLGSTLTASTSATVTGTPTPVTTWRWERSTNGTSGWTTITGETTTTYDIQDGDLGYYLRVVQIESNGVGTATSPSTSTVVVRTISGAFVARVVADGGEVENESAGTTKVEYLLNNP